MDLGSSVSRITDPECDDDVTNVGLNRVGFQKYAGISSNSFTDMGPVFLKHQCARCREAASAKLECPAISAEHFTKRPAVSSEMVSATRCNRHVQ